MRVPYVACHSEDVGVHASFGLTLSAIQPASFFGPPQEAVQPDQLWKHAHYRTVKLLNVLARWPHSCSIELHIVSHPSLDRKVQGSNEINLLFHVRGADQSTAIESALKNSIELEALLNSFWPTAEWMPVRKEQFDRCFRPFIPQSCLMIERRRGDLSLAQPFAPERSRMGFQASPRASGSKCSTRPTIRHLYPWVPAPGEDWSALLESLLALPTPRWVVVRMLNDPDGLSRNHALEQLGNDIETSERFLAGLAGGQITLSEQVKMIRDTSLSRYTQLMDGLLRGAVLVHAPGQPDYVTTNLLGQSITGDHSRRQINNLLQGGYSIRPVDPALAVDPFRCVEAEPFIVEECAGAFRLPLISDHRDLGLKVRRYRTVEFRSIPATDASSRIQLAVNVHRGMAGPIEIDTEDRMHHALYIGATGVGKSMMMLGGLLQDAKAGRGFALIDPPGELADEFLARFPKERIEDLVIVDFEDREFLVPLNLLAWSSADERDLIIDTLYGTLLSIYKSPEYFGPVFEQYFRSGLRLLLGDQPHRSDFTPTLLEFPQVLRNATFRRYLHSTLRDEEVKDAVEEAERVNSCDHKIENMAPYINSKFNRFLQDTQLRRIVGHGKMALNFREVMDAGKIIVFKLAQGRLGTHTADILTAQIVARFRLAAMSRADIPRAQRKPFFLYCDEAHAICDENIADMLSQCRKYSLGLVLATQYAKQLQDRGVLQAVLGTVGLLAAFRVSSEDAKLLEPVFSPTIGAQDLVECPNWSGYMRLHSGRSPVRPFSFHTVLVDTPADPEWAQELRDMSRRRWGVSAAEIDRRIKARRRFIRNLARAPSRKSSDEMCLELPLPDDEVVPEE